jgi:murein DD-endopeptidase MepM/ murein hydrolase activator NlpD
MKGLLLFLAGLLLGANAVYFLMARECPEPRAGQPTAVAGTAAPVPVEPSPSSPPVRTPATSHIPPTAGAPATAAAMQPVIATPPSAIGMLLPVTGIKPSQLTDTFNQSRGSERRHEALDIMAARGTPVLAAVDGKVEKLFTSKQGGLTIYEFDPAATHAYYYAHLDRYAAGLVEGMPLRRGDVIGYVGSTGNASPDAPHLHFAIFELGPEKHWWQGTAINPYPLLTASR